MESRSTSQRKSIVRHKSFLSFFDYQHFTKKVNSFKELLGASDHCKYINATVRQETVWKNEQLRKWAKNWLGSLNFQSTSQADFLLIFRIIIKACFFARQYDCKDRAKIGTFDKKKPVTLLNRNAAYQRRQVRVYFCLEAERWKIAWFVSGNL